jgi:peptidoglycan/LPS O-acetylase OafA/YrhL
MSHPLTPSDTQPTQGVQPVVRATRSRSNNLDFLRLLGALMVIFGHAYPLTTGDADSEPGVAGYHVSTLGVIVFFSISGYLITASWLRTRDALGYFAARCLRIFPAMIIVVAVSVWVLGPLVTTLTRSEYFHSPRTDSYLSNIWLLVQYDLPGMFTDLPHADVNGSLWTLPAEFFCYLVIPVAFLVPRALRVPVAVALLGTALWVAAIPVDQTPIIYGTPVSNAAELWAFFAVGALLRLLHMQVKGVFRFDVAVGLLAVYLLVIGIWPHLADKVSWIALPYVVMTVGLASTPYIRRAARFGDFSYGLYLWAFPVQQTVIHLIGVQPMWLNLMLVVAITAVLAVLSWHLVEHHALKLKDLLRLGDAPNHKSGNAAQFQHAKSRVRVTATGRGGEVSTRSKPVPAGHDGTWFAIDVANANATDEQARKGIIWGFYATQAAAQASAERVNKRPGHSANVVPAKLCTEPQVV